MTNETNTTGTDICRTCSQPHTHCVCETCFSCNTCLECHYDDFMPDLCVECASELRASQDEDGNPIA